MKQKTTNSAKPCEDASKEKLEESLVQQAKEFLMDFEDDIRAEDKKKNKYKKIKSVSLYVMPLIFTFFLVTCILNPSIVSICTFFVVGIMYFCYFLYEKLNSIEAQSKINNLFFNDIRSSISIILHATDLGRWEELQSDESIKKQLFLPRCILNQLKDRKLSAIEKELWRLYIYTKEYCFKDILEKIIEGKKVHFIFKSIFNSCWGRLLTISVVEEDFYDGSSFKIHSTYISEKSEEIIKPTFSDRVPHFSSNFPRLTEYGINSNKVLYREGLVDDFLDVLRKAKKWKALPSNITFETLGESRAYSKDCEDEDYY